MTDKFQHTKQPYREVKTIKSLSVNDLREGSEGIYVINGNVYSVVRKNNKLYYNLYSTTSVSAVDNKTLTFNSPATLTVNTGGTPVGTGVSDVQTMLDGNIYQLPEVTGTPGFDIEFAWTGITRIKGFAFRVWYVGTSTHQVTFRAYNYNTTVWDVLFEIPARLGYNYRCNQFPASNMANYFDSGGNAKVKIYHDTAGNASHDLYVDYVAIVN